MKTSRSEKTYSLLLRLYPLAFREDFGEAMTQHFRDQLNDARKKGGAGALATFWITIGMDTCVASVRARLEKEGSKKKSDFMKAKVPSFGFLFVAFWLPLLAAVGIYLIRQPKEYLAVARIAVQKTAVDANTSGSYDPYFLQTQFEIIKSGVTLEEVVRGFGLERKFIENGKDRIGVGGAVELLRQRIRIEQSRNTALTEIRVKWFDGDEAAQLVNRIIEVYRTKARRGVSVELLDRAERSMRPVSPNVPLIVTAGFFMSSLMSALGAWSLRFALRRNSSPAIAPA